MAKIIGLGGFFIKSTDTQRLSAWYESILGIKLETWGTVFSCEDLPRDVSQVFSIMPENTNYQAQDKSYMINWMIDDLDQFKLDLVSKGIQILQEENSEYGKFVHILDPDGNKLELWQPPSLNAD